MFYLLWALINIGLFLFISIKGSKYFRQKFGSIAAAIFVLGLISFIGRSNADIDNREPNSNSIKTWRFSSPDSLDKKSNVFVDIDLENTLMVKYILGIGYGKDKQMLYNIPTSANTYITGIAGGTSWKPVCIIVNRTADNHKFEYEVDGTIKWSLLGVPIYYQPKHWKGVALLK